MKAVEDQRKRTKEEELRARARQQAAVAELGQRALAGTHPSVLMDRAVALVAKALDVEYCKVLQLLPGGKALRLRAGVGWKEGLVGLATVSAGNDSQAGYTLRSGKPVIVKDLRREKRFKGPPLLRDHGVVSGISVIIHGRSQPYGVPGARTAGRRAFTEDDASFLQAAAKSRGRGRPYGVLNAHTTGLRTFTKEDVNFLQAVANVLASVIEGRQAEKQLRQKTSELEAILEAGPDLYFRLDSDGTILDYKAGRLSQLRVPAKAFLGRRAREVLPAKVGHQIDQAIQQVLKTDSSVAIEFSLPMPNGEQSYEARLAPLLEGQIIVVVRDITESKLTEKALRESEEQHRTLLENYLDGIGMVVDGKIAYVNPVLCEMVGYTAEEVQGRSPGEFLVPEDRKRAAKRIRELYAGASEYPSEYHLLKRDGGIISVEITSRVIQYAGKPALLSVFHDITDRKRAEEALRESEEKYSNLFYRSNDGIFIHDLAGDIIDVNQKVLDQLGYTKAELLSLKIPDLHPPEALKTSRYAFERISQDGFVRFEVDFKKKNGEVFPAEVSASLFEVAGRKVVQGIVRDISERKRAEEALQHQAYHDALTDLPNRALLKEHLNLALAQARRNKRMVAVMFLDLDRFKLVTDTVGHDAGDQMIGSVAEGLRGAVGEGDTVARLGDDEFALLLLAIDRVEEAVNTAERVSEIIKQPWMLAGQEFYITTTIGIAVYPNDGKDAEALLRNADTAMHRAKEQGGNCYQLYTPTMNAKILERLALENDLRHALEREEFVVYYQPQVDIATGRIVGVEALVRWQHPDLGLVFPLQFIPTAEETGLIVPIGEWVLRTACAQNKAWQDAGFPPIRMAVNLSACQFQQQNLVETIAQVLKETGLDPHHLELEITEGTAMQDVDFTIKTLRGLKGMGIQVSIDDFGTGHSSLSYLNRLPVHAVKIDRSFVQDIGGKPDSAAIASAIIVLAQSLGLRVIAEGVETKEQLAFLRQRRCDEMQGYLFSKPVPADAVEKIIMLQVNGRRAGKNSKNKRRRQPVGLTR